MIIQFSIIKCSTANITDSITQTICTISSLIIWLFDLHLCKYYVTFASYSYYTEGSIRTSRIRLKQKYIYKSKSRINVLKEPSWLNSHRGSFGRQHSQDLDIHRHRRHACTFPHFSGNLGRCKIVLTFCKACFPPACSLVEFLAFPVIHCHWRASARQSRRIA